MEERRRIDRVAYDAKSVVVVCDTQEKIFAQVVNLSPLGMAVRLPKDAPDILGKDIIIVAETLIMYADVIRKDEPASDGTVIVGISARKFTGDVLEYLFDRITLDEDK
ncbi:MAG: hypothetical protein J6U15_01085 [Lachnospiraceae bacterium]|nr:hypothetical protein [Lachnospiraceae bacterium]